MMNTKIGTILMVLVLICGIAYSKTLDSTVQLKKGHVDKYDFKAMKMHVYFSKDKMSDVCFMFEKDGKGVLLESPAFWDNFNEYQAYLKDSGVKIEALLVPYHPLGASFAEKKPVKGAKVYSTQLTLDYWEKGFGAVMKQGIPKIFGHTVDGSSYSPDVLLKEGATEIAGIKMVIHDTYDGFDMEIPEMKTVYVHILGHDTHSEILSMEHLDSSIVNLKRYIANGYEVFLSSHYRPETKADARTKVDYLIKMKEIIPQSKTGQEFIANMKAAFPDYKEGYLQATASMFFKDYKRPGRKEEHKHKTEK